MGETDRRRGIREGVRVERDRGQVAGAALAVDIGLVEAALAAEPAADGAALHVPDHRPDALAADAQRHLAPWDHERPREAAAEYRAARTRSRGGPGLRELVDATLEELLIGAQIRELVSPRRRQSVDQADAIGQAWRTA